MFGSEISDHILFKMSLETQPSEYTLFHRLLFYTLHSFDFIYFSIKIKIQFNSKSDYEMSVNLSMQV